VTSAANGAANGIFSTIKSTTGVVGLVLITRAAVKLVIDLAKTRSDTNHEMEPFEIALEAIS
jgi:hypothetical protein